MEDGPPIFRQDITCPALLDFTLDEASVTGLSPCIAKLSSLFTYFTECLRANPGSLAATTGISVDFFSSGYLDVSVPPVCSVNLCIQLTVTAYAVGFPHSEIADLKRLLLPYLRLSQVVTSFIASDCPGIHRVRLVT